MAKTTILIAESDDEQFERVKALVVDLGLKPVRAVRVAEVLALINAGVDLAVINLLCADFSQPTFFESLEGLPKLGWFVEADMPNTEQLLCALRSGCCDWVERPSTPETFRKGLLRLERRHNRRVVTRSDVAESPRSRALVKEIARRIR